MQHGPCQCCRSCQSGSLLACNDEAAGNYQDMARVGAGHNQNLSEEFGRFVNGLYGKHDSTRDASSLALNEFVCGHYKCRLSLAAV